MQSKDKSLRLDQVIKLITVHENELITGIISLIDITRMRNQYVFMRANSYLEKGSYPCGVYTTIVEDEINVTKRRLACTRSSVKNALNQLNAEKFNHPDRPIKFRASTIDIIRQNKSIASLALQMIEQCLRVDESGSRLEFLLSDKQINCFKSIHTLLKRILNNRDKIVNISTTLHSLRCVTVCIPFIVDTLDAVILVERCDDLSRSGSKLILSPRYRRCGSCEYLFVF
ncbi:hypothetical protein GJ496_011824 [Pomphorhynchus laevis]|nr:hypothetical protein GJ496_011824 [Pomphorhynchus laevis]